MPPKNDDDWSDSDDDDLSDIETNVQLGLSDGPIETSEDLRDARVSRLGGHAVFLSSPPPPATSAQCKTCGEPMSLLAQVWCPLEESPNDRALYVWGCGRGACQKKDGSVRAWRQLRYNTKYAEKLAKKAERQKAKEESERKTAEEAARRSLPKANPFSMKSTAASNPFDLGSQVFGNTPTPTEPNDASSPSEEAVSDEEDVEEPHEDADLAARLASTTLDDSKWTETPAYGALYLSTTAEYLPPAKKVKVPKGAEVDEDDEGTGKGKDGGWALEGYENSIEVDHAFERFTKRVGYEGGQCIRYELGGTPLPFASDAVFDKLFPAPIGPPLPVTKPDFMVVPVQKRTYTPASIPACPHCGGPRAFECQLMPNLINVLRASTKTGEGKKKLSDEERRQQVMKELKGEGAEGRVGMEWGTCMVFSCQKDCSDEAARGCWREELVLVQWDD
ncbi:programmed cell death protein 2 [Fomitopsis serialis]|uniref:programmed cell death protein 2 n=1 Tax=Fomitopsis serialis TaxID=139415 RepID=UPI002007BBB1|nr:programmed cell death protein 2 [Neoantrodia serialis]KAH9933363.1 programmed cell death protein 2 [Neoantrodia serialis]